MYTKTDCSSSLAIANDPNSTAAQLTEAMLEHYGHIEVAKAVAIHPNCSIQLMRALYVFGIKECEKNERLSEYKKVGGWLLHFKYLAIPEIGVDDIYGAPQLDEPDRDDICALRPQIFKVLHVLKHGSSKDIRQVLALEDLPVEVIREHGLGKNALIRKTVAARLTNPGDVYQALVTDSLKSIRQTLAKNTHVPAKYLAILSKDKDNEVKQAAFENISCPRDVLLEKKADRKRKMGEGGILALSVKEKYQMLTQADTPKEVLASLFEDELPTVRYLAAHHKNADDAILALATTDKESWVREAAAYSSNASTELLEILIKLNEPSIDAALVANSALTEKQACQLARRLKGDVPRERMANTSLFDSVRQMIAKQRDKDFYINEYEEKEVLWETHLDEVSSPTITPVERLKKLKVLVRSRNFRYLWASRMLARTPDCPDHMLAYFSFYCPEELVDNPALALKFLENPGAIAAEPYKDWKVKQWLSDGMAPAFVSNYFLRDGNIRQRRLAAKGWFTTVYQYQELAVHLDKALRLALSERDDLTNFMWAALAIDTEPDVRKTLAANESLPRALLLKLVEDDSPSVRMVATKSAKKRKVKLKSAPCKTEISSLDKQERIKIAGKTTSREEQLGLARDLLAPVRAALLTNRELSAEIYSILANDKSKKIRATVAGRRALDNELIQQLLCDKDSEVREYLATNKVLQPHHWLTLMEDDDDKVRRSIISSYRNSISFAERAAWTDADKHNYALFNLKMANDSNSENRRVAAKYLETKAAQMSLVENDDVETFSRLFSNSCLDNAVVSKVVASGSCVAKLNLLREAHRFDGVYLSLTRDEDESVRARAMNASSVSNLKYNNFDDETIQDIHQLMVNDKSAQVRVQAAKCRAVVAPLLLELVKDSDDEVRLEILRRAQQSRSSGKWDEEFGDFSYEELIERSVEDASADVRYQLISKDLDVRTLRRLSEDRDTKVSSYADTVLKRLSV